MLIVGVDDLLADDKMSMNGLTVDDDDWIVAWRVRCAQSDRIEGTEYASREEVLTWPRRVQAKYNKFVDNSL